MSKINNFKISNSVILSLTILAMLVLGIFALPDNAYAGETGSNYTWQGANTGSSYVPPTYYNQYPPAPVYYNPQPTPVYVAPVSYETPTINSNTTVKAPAKKTVAKTKTTNSGTAKAASGNLDGYMLVKLDKPVDATATDQGLAANVIFGDAGSFLPSGLLGWILLSILILAIVILARKVFGGAKRFMSTPLKHS